MKLLGIGDNTVDIYVDRGQKFPGGNSVNVAVFAKRLGFEASYIGCIGNDSNAELIDDALSQEKIDITKVRRLDEPNSWTRIRHDGTDRVFDSNHRIDLSGFVLDESDLEFIATHDHAHSSVYSEIESELPKISEAVDCLSFDFSDSYPTEYVREIAPLIDVAFLSGSELELEDCKVRAREFASLGCETTIITRGAAGAIGFQGKNSASSKPADGAVVDTLGAGDGFIAGFLVSYHLGSSLEEALYRGSINASVACSEHGAFGHASEI